MFESNKRIYATNGVMHLISSEEGAESSNEIIGILMGTINQMTVKKDYLQIFSLERLEDNTLVIDHSQEVPKFSEKIFSLVSPEYKFKGKHKIWAIDNGEIITFLLPEEY